MTIDSERPGPAVPDNEAARRMWHEYVAAHPEHAEDDPSSECFGDSTELADALLGLVLQGPKRATAGAVAEFENAGEPLPRIGSHWIVHDSVGAPRAVLRSLELRIGPLDSVDEAFAWDEGEGDRTRDSWMRDHTRYFERTLAASGVPFHSKIDVVFERFAVVWPSSWRTPEPSSAVRTLGTSLLAGRACDGDVDLRAALATAIPEQTTDFFTSAIHQYDDVTDATPQITLMGAGPGSSWVDVTCDYGHAAPRERMCYRLLETDSEWHIGVLTPM